jgi:hypothetical protein
MQIYIILYNHSSLQSLLLASLVIVISGIKTNESVASLSRTVPVRVAAWADTMPCSPHLMMGLHFNLYGIRIHLYQVQ